jgi:outer membrane protein, heavy metal efflux system
MKVCHYARRLRAVVIPAIFLFASAAPTAAQQGAPPAAPAERRPSSGPNAPAAPPVQQHHQPRNAPSGAGGVTLASLVEAARAASPELAARRREFDAARARIPQAEALPDPTVSFLNNTQGNPIPFAGLKGDFGEIMVGFSQDLPWFGVRRLRAQAAGAEAEAKFQEYLSAAWQLTADVKTTYYDLYNLDRALAVIARDRDILEKVTQVAEARYAVGKAQQVDVINARVEITELMHRQGQLEAKRALAAARLNQLLFRDPETEIGALAELKMSPEPPPPDELARLAAENAPDLKQHRSRIDAGNKALRLAEREAKYPEVGLNFSYHNRPAFPDYYTYGVTLRLPLYAATKQRYAIKEQAANLAATEARLDANLSLIRYRLRDARVRATTAARLIRLHEQGLIPQGTLALESALAAYQVGNVDFPTVLTALKRVLDYELEYYELLADYQKALAEMERFTGVELTKQ